ncbi:MAG TPA: hypothetical protein VN025_07705 [Candidatus Dormibacteraeota bacterium]|jgi:hypothetical protein|nr:hypothetical protein [Candidatus Dormibacteraeota bacterium]
MTLLDPPTEPQGKSSALKFTLIAVAMAAIIGGWFLFRYYPEKRAVDHFFDALVAGDTARAYQDWKPSQSYKMGDFLADWGPDGYYGPVKSYEILRSSSPKNSNGVIISVAVSPFSPMPGANDAEKSRRTKTIPLWVDTESKAISFSPNSADE